MKLLTLTLAKEQPKGGYMHPGHFLAYGPVHRGWSIGKGWYETDKWCLAPNTKLAQTATKKQREDVNWKPRNRALTYGRALSKSPDR